jgi:hypothetical protein
MPLNISRRFLQKRRNECPIVASDFCKLILFLFLGFIISRRSTLFGVNCSNRFGKVLTTTPVFFIAHICGTTVAKTNQISA